MNLPNCDAMKKVTAGSVRVCGRGGKHYSRLTFDVARTLDRLQVEQVEETGRISILGGNRRPRSFSCPSIDGPVLWVHGTYPCSILHQSLAWARDQGRELLALNLTALLEPPQERLTLLTKQRFWAELSRRTDEWGLSKAFDDPKLAQAQRRLYVAPTDEVAREYFAEVAQCSGAELEILPPLITPKWYTQHYDCHGLLALKLRKGAGGAIEGVPFVTPGGRFNEMYGWDSYFIILGLLESGKMEEALDMVENLFYQLEHYGKILNATRSWSLNRSQAPFLTAIVCAVYEKYEGKRDRKKWLARALSWAAWEYENVWMVPRRLCLGGLNRYRTFSTGPAPEVEEGQYYWYYRRFVTRLKLSEQELESRIQKGELRLPELDMFFLNDCAVRESGFDKQSRWGSEARCSEFVTVDLNCLLYRYEVDMVFFLETEFGGVLKTRHGVLKASEWRERALRRRMLIRRHLYDEKSGLFFDFDLRNKVRPQYVCLTGFYPLWASRPEDPDLTLLSSSEAEHIAEKLTRALEFRGGMFATTLQSVERTGVEPGEWQWDYPSAWPNLIIIVLQALVRFGLFAEARRLAAAWLNMVVWNFAAHGGLVTEKYNGEDCSPFVSAEYGTVGADMAGAPKTGFGWTNASILISLSVLETC